MARPGTIGQQENAEAAPVLVLRGQAPLPEVWRVMGSNHRRLSRQIYSLLPLATRATRRGAAFAAATERIADSRTASHFGWTIGRVRRPATVTRLAVGPRQGPIG